VALVDKARVQREITVALRQNKHQELATEAERRTSVDQSIAGELVVLTIGGNEESSYVTKSIRVQYHPTCILLGSEVG
jgi:hypothetical protein